MPRATPRPFNRNLFEVTATLDASGLNAALERLQRESGKDMAKLVKESSRRLGIRLAIASFPKQLASGVRTITSDARKVYPSRRAIGKKLDDAQKGAAAIFFVVLKKSAALAIRFAQKIGVNIQAVSKIDNKLVRQSVSFSSSSSGSRSSRKVTTPTPLQMLKNRDDALEKNARKLGKRVGTAANGWVQSSLHFGPMRSDGVGAGLQRFKKTRRPMETGRGRLVTTGPRTVGTLTNLVDYSSQCISQNSLLYQLNGEIKNLGMQSKSVMQRRANSTLGVGGQRSLT